MRIFENRGTQDRRSLAVSLNDGKGNRSGIGAKVFIRMAGGTGQQMREIKASGGYMSFDAPVAHFGLGQTDHVEEIRVRWRDGTETVLPGPFAAGYHYRVERD